MYTYNKVGFVSDKTLATKTAFPNNPASAGNKSVSQMFLQYYTFVVGKINPEKLANFMGIDVFVLIACPENSLINSQVCMGCLPFTRKFR